MCTYLYTHIMIQFLLIVVGVSIAMYALMYLDTRLFDRPKTRSTYVKNILAANIVVLSVVGILSWLSPSGNIKEIVQAGGAEVKKITGKPTTFISQIGEEMLSGDAPF